MGTAQRPTLILFCGLPGSGKSTLARRFEAEGRGIRLCTDDWQAALGVPAEDGEFHERLQRLLYEHALGLLEHGQSVILEDGLWFKSERDEKLADARGALVELNVFEVDFDELWRRVQARNAMAAGAGDVRIERNELVRLLHLFETPAPDELAQFDTVVVRRPSDWSAQPHVGGMRRAAVLAALVGGALRVGFSEMPDPC